MTELVERVTVARPRKYKADDHMLKVVIRIQSVFRMMRAVRKMKEDMKGVVCRFFKRDAQQHLALVTIYKTMVERKKKRKKTVTKTTTNTKSHRDPNLASTDSLHSQKPWEVDRQEVDVQKTQTEEVVESETVTAYQIIAENDVNRSN
jgi:hypothetical protein